MRCYQPATGYRVAHRVHVTVVDQNADIRVDQKLNGTLFQLQLHSRQGDFHDVILPESVRSHSGKSGRNDW